MIIITFCNKTSKLLPRLLCKNLKHTAPIGVYQDKLVLYQFVKSGVTEKIHLNMRDLQILQQHGWRFIYLTGNLPYDFCNKKVHTCVQLSKAAIGIKNLRIQTPNSLYKYLLDK